MLAHGGGSIVNTASTSGVTGIAGIALYTASKHAVVGLTKAAALEVAQSKIRVNAVAPGPVRTGFLLRMLDGKVPVDQITGPGSHGPHRGAGGNRRVHRVAVQRRGLLCHGSHADHRRRTHGSLNGTLQGALTVASQFSLSAACKKPCTLRCCPKL